MERYAIQIFNKHGDDFSLGAPVLWKGLTLKQVKEICNHPNTKGRDYFLGFVKEKYLNPKHKVIIDDGRFKNILEDLGIVI